jgi:hypothetical protein
MALYSGRENRKKLLLNFPPAKLSGADFYLGKNVLTFSGLIHLGQAGKFVS